MNESLGQRLATRRKELDLSQTDIAERLGVTPQSVQQWESDRTAPRNKRLESLASVLMCSPEWLQFGGESSSNLGASNEPEFVGIPVYNVELSAGNGKHIDAEKAVEFYDIAVSRLAGIGTSQHNAVVVRVRGDSMEHTLHDGDVILVDTSVKSPISGKIFAFAFDDELRVKRFTKRLDGSWTISSDNSENPAYRDETVSGHNIQQLRIIGQVKRVLDRDVT